jgi:signal transduction histidine kinase/Tfp pilus assembly protein PilF
MFKNKFLKFLIFLFAINLSSQNITIENINKDYESGLSILEKEASQKALNFILNGLEQAKVIENDSLIGFGYFYLGDYYIKTRHYKSAIDAFENAKNSFNNLSKISKCYFEIGYTYNLLSNHEKALSNYYKSLTLKEKLNDDLGVALLLNNIGKVYLDTKDFNKATVNFNKALEINSTQKDTVGIVSNLSNIGVIYQKQKEFNKAIDYFKKALVQAKSADLRINESILLGNIGSTLRELNRYDESLNYLFQAIKLKKELKRNGSIAHTYNDISETYTQMGMFEKGKEYAFESLKYSKKENFNQQKESYQLLSNSNYKLENYKASHDNLVVFNALKDSLFSIEKAKSMNEIKVIYETEKRDLKIKAQESDIALLDEKNKVKNQWLLFGGMGLLTTFGFVLLFRSRNNARKRQKVQVQFSQDLIKTQEEERIRVARELHDSVGQKLILLTKKIKSSGDENLECLAGNTLEELRSVSRGLHPITIERFGVTAAITSMINEVDKNTNIFFTSDIDNIDAKLSKDTALHLYRIIQEVLNNMVKHAEAKTAFITVEANENAIKATIKDNGKGFEFSKASKKHHSLGMKTLMERAKIIKSKLHINTQPNKGTEVLLTIPV